MDRLGRFALLLALALAAYGLVAALVGARRGRAPAAESARTTAYALLAAVAAANGAMLAAILSNDFALRYVAENSSRATPAFFKVLALWSADDGSLLLWNLVLPATSPRSRSASAATGPRPCPGRSRSCTGSPCSTCCSCRARRDRSRPSRPRQPTAARVENGRDGPDTCSI